MRQNDGDRYVALLETRAAIERIPALGDLREYVRGKLDGLLSGVSDSEKLKSEILYNIIHNTGNSVDDQRINLRKAAMIFGVMELYQIP